MVSAAFAQPLFKWGGRRLGERSLGLERRLEFVAFLVVLSWLNRIDQGRGSPSRFFTGCPCLTAATLVVRVARTPRPLVKDLDQSGRTTLVLRPRQKSLLPFDGILINCYCKPSVSWGVGEVGKRATIYQNTHSKQWWWPLLDTLLTSLNYSPSFIY